MNAPVSSNISQGCGSISLSTPCPKCGCTDARIVEKGFQDVAYCTQCDAYIKNVPRKETGKPQRHIKTRDGISGELRNKVLILRANGRCEICGGSGTDHNPLQVGHLVSVENGRRAGISDDELNHEENLAAMCAACNSALGSSTVPARLLMRVFMMRMTLLKEKGF
jgi:hypothetical protein